MIKVMKFGGTSVGSEKALGNLVSIVRNEPSQKALVVSAMSGVTNTLIALMRDPKLSNDSFFDELLQRHVLAARPFMDQGQLDDLEMKLKLRIFGLRQALDRYLADGPDREALQDAVSSWGERLSSLMVASVLKAQGMDAVAMASEEAGIAAWRGSLPLRGRCAAGKGGARARYSPSTRTSSTLMPPRVR